MSRLAPRALVALVALLVLPAVRAQPTSTPAGLAEQIAEVLDSPAFDNAYWGALVVDLETGKTFFSRDAEKRFIPASNMKLFTTASVIDALGPNFTYVTRLYADGEVRDGTLHGPLVVRGSGDPTFGGRYTGGDLLLTFRQWADSLQAAGIHEITGVVVGDDNVFDNVPLGEGWQWDDLVWYYGAEISGLQFNEGTVNLTVRGTTPGQRATIEVEPDIDYFRFANETTTTRGGGVVEGYSRALGSNDFRVWTSVPAGGSDTESLSVVNPTEYFVRTMVAVFKQRGITVEGEAVDVDEWGTRPRYDLMRRVATHTSPPLRAIIGQTNTDSNNLYAEHLLRTLGAYVYTGSDYALGSAQAGVAASEPFLRRIGVDPESFRIADGSGLSALNRLTPVGIVGILRGMYAHPDRDTWDAFYRSLAVGGYTGTLDGRYRSGDARGNVHAKTGYISGARTLSGYVRAHNGHLMAFSLLCNNYTVPTRRVNQAQDEIVELLADYEGE